MARRVDHSAEELHNLIIVTAEKIIVEQGLRSLSTRELAKRIGYTSGTLYQHFSDINDIILHVNVRTMQRLVDRMKASRAKASDEPSAQIHAYADTYMAYIRKNRNAWDAMFEYHHPADHVVPEWYATNIETLVSLVERSFARLSNADGTTSPNQAARMVWASVHSVCSLEGGGRLQLLMHEKLETLIHKLVDVHVKAFVRARSKRRSAVHRTSVNHD